MHSFIIHYNQTIRVFLCIQYASLSFSPSLSLVPEHSFFCFVVTLMLLEFSCFGFLFGLEMYSFFSVTRGFFLITSNKVCQ
jgi:hypothetical protein